MPALVSAIDNLTLTITQEMLVRASLEKLEAVKMIPFDALAP